MDREDVEASPVSPYPEQTWDALAEAVEEQKAYGSQHFHQGMFKRLSLFGRWVNSVLVGL